MFCHAVKEGEEFVGGGGGDHGDAELLEIAKAAEVAPIVFAHLEDGGVLAFELNGGEEVSAAYFDTLLDGDGAFFFTPKKSLCLLEYPRIANGGTTNENAVDTVASASLDGLLGSGDVAVAEDGDVHAGVVLNLADEGPVSGALVHLGLGASVDAEGGDADVLESFGKFYNGTVVSVVSEAGLDGDGEVCTTDEGFGDVQHLGNVAEDAAAGSFACHLADGATPVDVDEVGLLLLHDVEALDEFILVGTEYLDADGVLLRGEEHFAAALLGIAVESFGSDELGDKKVGTKLLAELAEGEVGNVVHG